MNGIMGSDSAVQMIDPAGEIYTCPAYGYTDGFHVSFKVSGDRHSTEIYVICPDCHQRFRPGWKVRLRHGLRHNFIQEFKLELLLVGLLRHLSTTAVFLPMLSLTTSY